MIKTLLFSILLVLGSQAVNSATIFNYQSTQTASAAAYYYEYQWIGGVRWVFVYSDDGILINSYPEE
ncbi:MAG TPA: hypothetical protein VGK25_09635 [Ignavibacteria bacterium]